MTLKVSLLAAAVLALGGSAVAQTKLTGPFTLTVDLSKAPNASGKVYFMYYNTVTKARAVDSAEVGAAPVVFKGELPEPTEATLYLVPAGEKRPIAKNVYAIYLQPGDVKLAVKDSLSNGVVTGDAAQPVYLALKKSIETVRKPLDALNAEYMTARNAHDSAGMKQVEEKYDALEGGVEKAQDSLYKQFITVNGSKSPVAVYALKEYAGYMVEPAKVEPMYNKLSKAYQELPTAQELAAKVAIAKKLEVGQYAIEFTQNDTLGNAVALSSFRGKYVLIDFWASWCGPCRAENPNVVKAFNKYKEKGFTVLGVSLDQPGAHDKWLKAIHNDQLTWTHVSDLQFWNNAVAKAYGIQSIPQNFLIDPQGKIIAKNVRGEALEKKLEEVFN